jgi:hypothetical protein
MGVCLLLLACWVCGRIVFGDVVSSETCERPCHGHGDWRWRARARRLDRRVPHFLGMFIYACPWTAHVGYAWDRACNVCDVRWTVKSWKKKLRGVLQDTSTRYQGKVVNSSVALSGLCHCDTKETDTGKGLKKTKDHGVRNKRSDGRPTRSWAWYDSLMPRPPMSMSGRVSRSACMHVTDRTEDLRWRRRESDEFGRAAHDVSC